MDFSKIEKDALENIKKSQTVADLENIRLKYFSKKGLITEQMKNLSQLSLDEKKDLGNKLNKIKKIILDQIEEQKIQIQSKNIEEKISKERIDITLPSRNFESGRIHPISQTIEEVIHIFSGMGFSVAEGPDIETDFNNFTALNIPPYHPAREMQDTFYLTDKNLKEKLVLRTHTSPVQVRTMLEKKPPLKIIVPGRTYRCDSDTTHAPMFHQVEGLLIDNDSNMANLKGCLVEFLKIFFEDDNLKYRFRPSYFPFTEPSAEMDVAYERKGDTIKVGQGDNWLEILGSGMVNPKVLENCKIDNKQFQGFAFGMGIERISMLKYGITDLRSFFETDLRWIKHYGFNPLQLSSLSGL